MRDEGRIVIHLGGLRGAVSTFVVVVALAVVAGGGRVASVGPPASSGSSPSSGRGVSLSVEGAWVRAVPMPGGVSAAYMVVVNAGATDDAIVGADSPAAATLELDETQTTDDGLTAMLPVDAIPLPAGSSSALEPGGYHVMLIDLVSPLLEGHVIGLTLTLASGGTLEVEAAVRAAAPMPSMAPMPTMAPMPSMGG